MFKLIDVCSSRGTAPACEIRNEVVGQSTNTPGREGGSLDNRPIRIPFVQKQTLAVVISYFYPSAQRSGIYLVQVEDGAKAA